MLKTVVTLNIFVEKQFFSEFFDEWKFQKNSSFLKNNILNVFALTFNIIWSLLKKNIDFFPKKIFDTKLFNGSV